MAKPLKQLMTACWMSRPRLSKALMVESNTPGLRPQNIWMFTALPSLTLTSTYKQKPHIQANVEDQKETNTCLLYQKCFPEEKKIITLAGWPFGLGNELGHSLSLIWLGRVDGVGVKGWKLVGVKEEPGGVDSNSLWRSLILCRSSFKYSIASPRIDALSICHHNNVVTHIMSF